MRSLSVRNIFFRNVRMDNISSLYGACSVSVFCVNIISFMNHQQCLAQRTYVMYSGLSQALYSLKSSSQVALIRDNKWI